MNIHKYGNHSDNRRMPIDQQRLGQPKAGDKVTDQQGAGAQSEAAKLKAQLQITDFPAC